jgi:tetratricopeptide (TPR) repeat protein
VGRNSQLDQLEETLSAEQKPPKVAIFGLGGVGKTQIALELAYRTQERYPECSIFWVPATNSESLQQAYLEIGRQLRIPGLEQEQADVKKLVQRYLSGESAGRWLLIFDNADDIDMWINRDGAKDVSPGLIDCLPQSNQGFLVFTTRSRKVAVKLTQQNVIEVLGMDEDLARQLLRKSLINQDLVQNHQDTVNLLKQLTFLPLALVQAAAYINENGITLSDYLSLLDDQEQNVIDLLSTDFEVEGRYRDSKNPVVMTWLISFKQIRQRDPLAYDYLAFLSCVSPRDIPQSLLPPAQSRKKEIDAIGTLSAYSFVSRRSATNSLDIHALVHLATRNWLRREESLAKWTAQAITRLGEVFPDNDHENRSVWRLYLPHAQYVLDSSFNVDGVEEKGVLLWKFGMCLYSDGRYNEAETPILRVMETRRKVLGLEHPDTLTSLGNLALTYWNQGRWTEAEELGVQVMETTRRVLGPEHPFTLVSMANLASMYMSQGRWTEAEELQVQVIKKRRKVLAPEHPDALTSLANLASTYWNRGRWTEAEELQVQVMETRRRVLGPEHPDTLNSMNNLTLTYKDQGRWTEAEKLGVRVMETTRRVLGPEHPDTLASMANLALTYRDQGRWTEAEELEVQVMETRRRVLGPEHPDTLASMNNLASTYRDQGRWTEAEELEVHVMETTRRVLGPEHPFTLVSMANLASTYRNQGRWTEAEELGVHVMETRRRVLGPEHPSTLTSMNNLAWTWKSQGRNREASELITTCCELLTEKLGADHPNTKACLKTLNAWKAGAPKDHTALSCNGEPHKPQLSPSRKERTVVTRP